MIAGVRRVALKVSLGICIVLGACAAICGCVGDDPVDATGTSSADSGPPETSTPVDSGSDSTETGPSEGDAGTASVRIGNVSADAPAIDICLSTHASGVWTAPVLAPSGLVSGVASGKMLLARKVPAGNLDVRIVQAGAADCNDHLAEVVDLATLAADGHYTVLIVGKQAITPKTLTAVAYVDDVTPSSDKTQLRFINADPDHEKEGLMDNQLDDWEGGVGGGPTRCFAPDGGSVASCAKLFAPIAFGQIEGPTAQNAVNANGYLVSDPMIFGVDYVYYTTGGSLGTPIGVGFPGIYALSKIYTFVSMSGAHTLYCDDLDLSKAPLANCVAE